MVRALTMAAVLTLLTGPVLAAQAVTVTLANGDTLSGALASDLATGDAVLDNPILGRVTLPRAQITTIAGADGAPLWPAPEPEAWERTRTLWDPRGYKWSGRVDLGASVDDGNSGEEEYSADVRVEARNAANRWTLTADSDFSRNEGSETENDHKLDLMYDRFATQAWFWGVRARAEVDKIADLDYRTRTGPFVGYQVWDRKDVSLSVRLGPEWQREKYAQADVKDDLAGFWSLDYEREAWRVLRAYHNHEIFAPLDAVDTFVFESDTGLRVPLTKHLVASAGVEFDWANDPPSGVDEEDVTYGLKLGWEW